MVFTWVQIILAVNEKQFPLTNTKAIIIANHTNTF